MGDHITPLSVGPELPTGDRPITRNKSFVIHSDQLAIIEQAITAAKSAGPFDDPNSNQNGNALERIAALYLASHGVS